MTERPLYIRPFIAGDRPAWDEMWAGYLTFYETVLEPSVSDDTWTRFLEPAPGHVGFLALDEEIGPVGFAHAIVHPGTWSPRPVCYLEDLFVKPDIRGRGVGGALIEVLARRGREEGWLRIYWQTAADNARAQALYDKIAKRTDWLRYDLDLS